MKKTNGLLIILSFFLQSCTGQAVQKVEIKKTAAGYQMYRGGTPFYVHGAGGGGDYRLLADYGGNSVRTWGTNDWEEKFKKAQENGLTVCAGMWLEQERQGFDYSNREEVQKQFEKLKIEILKYKDHPALLMWCIGNELDLSYKNPAVWDAVEEIARFIHEVDGNHPTMTVTAFIEKEEVAYIKEKCPHIDILGVNAYAGLPVLAEFLKNFGWEKPYIVAEWGPFGHWEVNKTSWGEPIEHSSTEKAEIFKRVYKENILSDPNCLGGYAFLWGSKQERTATWYSMFIPSGEKSEAVDVLKNLWSGEWPVNRAPRLEQLLLDGKNASENIIIGPGEEYTAYVSAEDPDSDSLKIAWEILHETTDKRSGGDAEKKPAPAEGLNIRQQQNTLTFTAPQQSGPYRIFVYVYDLKGSAAHANIPFYVKSEK